MSIDIAKLTDADKGREVRYDDYGKFEFGRITSWNDQFIFVRYHTRVWRADGKRDARTGTTSEATHPSDLRFI